MRDSLNRDGQQYVAEKRKDGTIWKMKLGYPDATIEVYGSNSFPSGFRFGEFKAAISELMGGRKFKSSSPLSPLTRRRRFECRQPSGKSQHGWWPQSFSFSSFSKRAICSSGVSWLTGGGTPSASAIPLAWALTGKGFPPAAGGDSSPLLAVLAGVGFSGWRCSAMVQGIFYADWRSVARGVIFRYHD